MKKLDEILSSISSAEQRATDLRMSIAATVGDLIQANANCEKDLAIILKCSRSFVKYYGNGTVDTTVSQIAKLEAYFGERIIEVII
jgi:hypothetical protein